MIVVMQGTPEFNDYNLVLRAMGVLLSENDDTYTVYTIGGHKLNQQVAEFANVAKLQERGVNFKVRLRPARSLDDYDLFYFFCNTGDHLSRQAAEADNNNKLFVFRS